MRLAQYFSGALFRNGPAGPWWCYIMSGCPPHSRRESAELGAFREAAGARFSVACVQKIPGTLSFPPHLKITLWREMWRNDLINSVLELVKLSLIVCYFASSYPLAFMRTKSCFLSFPNPFSALASLWLLTDILCVDEKFEILVISLASLESLPCTSDQGQKWYKNVSIRMPNGYFCHSG